MGQLHEVAFGVLEPLVHLRQGDTEGMVPIITLAHTTNRLGDLRDGFLLRPQVSNFLVWE